MKYEKVNDFQVNFSESVSFSFENWTNDLESELSQSFCQGQEKFGN